MVNLGNSWDHVLEGEFEKEYYQKLRQFLIGEYRSKTIYPDMHDIFNALKATGYDDVKVLILGQDPYHEPGQAHGMAFSVQPGIKTPPSLVNIYKEMKDDLGIEPASHGYLQKWAEQGVLLLNAVLTVRAHQAASHAGRGWEQFTDAVVRAIAERKSGVVYMLWGSYAQKKGAIANPANNLILKSVHPSPLSSYRGFFGCRHFSQANAYLRSLGKSEIVW